MRLHALEGSEIFKFHRMLLNSLPDDVDQTVLTECDIEKIVRENKDLDQYIDQLTDDNPDLAANLFRATVMFIDQQDYNGFEEHPTFAERPNNFVKKSQKSSL